VLFVGRYWTKIFCYLVINILVSVLSLVLSVVSSSLLSLDEVVSISIGLKLGDLDVAWVDWDLVSGT
jgi:hypothetical protein